MELGAKGNYIKEVKTYKGSELTGKGSRAFQRFWKPRPQACLASSLMELQRLYHQHASCLFSKLSQDGGLPLCHLSKQGI